MIMTRFLLIFLMFAATAAESAACTSVIVSGRVTRSGRPMIWKHRDTGTEHNFIARVGASGNRHGYVALFNGGDSLLNEAWTGMNDAGFAIMNTASYNLMPDTATVKDREGIVMRLALERCITLDDFEKLLDELPKPLGVQANFGVMDSSGRAAYYETDDYDFKRYLLDDEPSGIIYRTNYSYSGEKDGGYGYIRESNARHLATSPAKDRRVTPELFTDTLSKSFYHSLIGRDFMKGDDRWVSDRDFIPRRSSAASIVIEGLLPGESPESMTMWTVIGYPPVSHTEAVTLDSVPQSLQPSGSEWRSPLCDETLKRKREVFPITRGSGEYYLDIDKIREYMPQQLRISQENYARCRAEIKKRSEKQ